jgi:uncharacterized membrane protein YwzB
VDKILRLLLFTTLLSLLSGCVYLRKDSSYKGPPERPLELTDYYKVEGSYSGYKELFRTKYKRYTVRRFEVASSFGTIKIDYFFKERQIPSDALVFVFPALGGKNVIENYFADYFATSEVDTAIVHRSNDFKDPSRFDELEAVLRNNIIRDRIAMDFFEKEFGKKKFGSFGISRGALNASMTAGIDKRLEYNVLVLGGTDLVGIFKNSNQPRINRYIQKVMEVKGLSKDKFYDTLRERLKTDPKYMAQYLDARKTLLVLAAFDRTVPFKYGMKLRKQIGNPRTIILLADHYTSVLYTQIVKIFPPNRTMSFFPFDYIESEALQFYRKSFNVPRGFPALHLVPIKIIQAPFNWIAEFVNWMRG